MSTPGSPRHAGDDSSADESSRVVGESPRHVGETHGVGDVSSAGQSSRVVGESPRHVGETHGAGDVSSAGKSSRVVGESPRHVGESHGAGDVSSAGESSRPPGDAADYGLPEHPACPFCERENTELHSAFGPQLSVATYWCRDCRAPFDFVKWKSG